MNIDFYKKPMTHAQLMSSKQKLKIYALVIFCSGIFLSVISYRDTGIYYFILTMALVLLTIVVPILILFRTEAYNELNAKDPLDDAREKLLSNPILKTYYKSLISQGRVMSLIEYAYIDQFLSDYENKHARQAFLDSSINVTQ